MALSATQLVSSLREIGLRHRSGLLQLPNYWLGREREIAARLGIGYQDYQRWLLDHLADGQRYLGFDWRQVISRDLHGMLLSARPDGDCLLVSNLDLGICTLSATDRQEFWTYLREIYRPSCGLLVTLPESSQRVITDAERGRWDDAHRLAYWNERVR